jgi:hypothetical protein
MGVEASEDLNHWTRPTLSTVCCLVKGAGTTVQSFFLSTAALLTVHSLPDYSSATHFCYYLETPFLGLANQLGICKVNVSLPVSRCV